MNPQSPPQDPEYTSEPNVLSPVSPKPVHYPVPSNIPVLANQTDLAFNQTHAHMAEAAAQHQHSHPRPHHQAGGQPTDEAGSSAAVVVPSATAPNAVSEPGQPHAQPQQAWSRDGGFRDETQGARADSELNNDHPNHASSDSHAAAATAAREPTQSQPSHDHRPRSTQTPSDSALPASNVTAQSHDAFLRDFSYAEASGLTVGWPSGVGSNTGGVDYQTLLDNLSPATANAPQAEGLTVPTTASPSSSPAQPSPGSGSALSPTVGFGGLPASLPPRPPPQQQPSIHPNYTHTMDIRDYHPHSHAPGALPHAPPPSAAAAATSTPTTTSTTFRPNAQLPFPAAPGQAASAGANGLPPPPVASFQQAQSQIDAVSAQSQSPASQAKQRQRELESQREIKQAAGEVLDDADAPWTPETQRLYDNFLGEERRYVTEGNWEQFPYGSRLFVGNLSSERVTKRDIFHVFHTYGALAQISIKQAYGFVQFLETGPCQKALQAEEGKTIRGKKIHLEISKPQKNRNSDARGNRRSRSPDHGRAGHASSGAGSGGNNKRNDKNEGNERNRRRRDDQYRPGRSPSPRGYRGRDRSRDRYDGRYRSRSRSPHHGRGGRYRSPTPVRDTDDDLPLPRRDPRNVPDVQIIVLDELDRNFIGWVERAFTSVSIRVDVLLLSPRLSEAAVIRRQIIEGVLAVSRVTRTNQQTAKIPLQVFDRSRGAGDVRFEEYDNLEPSIAAQLVLRAKANASFASQQPPIQYGYGAGTTHQQPVTTTAPDLTNLITSLDTSGLQKLLGVMQPPTPQQPSSGATTALTPDLVRLFGNAGAPVPPPPPPPAGAYNHMPPAPDPLAALRANPALAGLLGQIQQPISPQAQQHAPPPPQGPQQGQPDMAEILARLARR
ncbi:hypothetical protein MBLNU459_g2667t1 [Dothideomycetes sp. NU459]